LARLLLSFGIRETLQGTNSRCRDWCARHQLRTKRDHCGGGWRPSNNSPPVGAVWKCSNGRGLCGIPLHPKLEKRCYFFQQASPSGHAVPSSVNECNGLLTTVRSCRKLHPIFGVAPARLLPVRTDISDSVRNSSDSW